MVSPTRLRFMAVAAVILLAGACASGGGPIKAATPTKALVYGHLDLPESVRSQIQWIHVYGLGEVYAPPFKTAPAVRFFPNGDFYVEGVKPGKYYVHHLVAGMEGFYLYPPNRREGKQIIIDRAIEVGSGQVAYLGNHRVHEWKRGVSSKLSPKLGSFRLMPQTPGAGPEPLANFMNHSSLMTAGSGTFTLEHAFDAGVERRVIKHVLQEVKGSGWDTRLETRLGAIP